MKKLLVFLILIIGSILVASTQQATITREEQAFESISSGDLEITLSNNATIESPESTRATLIYPIGSENNYLYKAALWFGAKTYRRFDDGRMFYWKNFPPTYGDHEVTLYPDSAYIQPAVPVLDTLVTVGFDGDADLHEFLPAYNDFEDDFVAELFNQYNETDKPIKIIGAKPDYDDDSDGSTDEDFLGREFLFPDSEGTYCFTNDFENETDVNLPGFQTVRTISYDFSPFGNPEERDTNFHSTHFPLDVAVEQFYYTWPAEYFSNAILIETKIMNTNEEDTLYDFTYGYLVDPDIGSINNDDLATDDISTFYEGENNFPYSYNLGENGTATGLISAYVFHPENLNNQVWSWQVGDGPDDEDARAFPYNNTSNEKYWLMNGQNPDSDDYISIKDNPNYQLDNNPSGTDTRFLYSIYGDNQGYENATANSLNLEPNESFSFYTLIIVDESLQQIDETISLYREFIQSDFDYEIFEERTSIPHLTSLKKTEYGSIKVTYDMLTDPDYATLLYKNISESEWQNIDIAPYSGVYTIAPSNLNENATYEVKILSNYDGEIIESNSQRIDLETGTANDIIESIFDVKCYPNPFKVGDNSRESGTTINFSLKENSKVNLSIFNIKGQKIITLVDKNLISGNHAIKWNGKSSDNQNMPSSMYFYKLETENYNSSGKMLLLK